jgi:hypothetical protein
MPCRTEAINPFGSAIHNPKLSRHEGIDFSGNPKRIIQTLDGLQGSELYLERVPK